MNNILRKINDPVRLANHFSIKFLNKKIQKLNEIEVFFSGKSGLEIGGPSKIFGKAGYIPIYPIATSIDGINFSNETVWENVILEGKTYNYGGTSNGYQFIHDTTDLSAIESGSYDFLLSSHSLEHIANPFKALAEWLRVLKKDGAIVLVLPDQRYTFDCRRQVTTFEHLLQDYKINTREDDLTHLEEVLSLHDLSYDEGVKNFEDFKKRSADNFKNRCIHQHVFDMKLIEQIFNYFKLRTILTDVSPPFNLIIIGAKVDK